MRLGQHVNLTVVGQYVDIYTCIYKGAFSSQDPRNLWLCLVCLVNNFYLPLWSRMYTPNWSLHHCIKKKNESDKYMLIHFITCFMPDRLEQKYQQFTICSYCYLLSLFFVDLLWWPQCFSVTCYSPWWWVGVICWWVINHKQRACYSPFKSFSGEDFFTSPRGSLRHWRNKRSTWLWNHYCWGETTCSIWSSWLVEHPTPGPRHGHCCWPWC